MAVKSHSWTVWRLRRGMDRRFRSGHPWVYSNELMESPKGLEAGAPVELQDAGGRFLARGYGNPHSLIAFRSLSRDEAQTDTGSVEALGRVLAQAGQLRAQLGLSDFSHRLCFGEADGIPGLVIDRYLLDQPSSSVSLGQVFVVQAHTAGADRLRSNILEILKTYVASGSQPIAWKNTAVLLRNDLSVRKLEGLNEEPPLVLQDMQGLDLQKAQIVKIRVAPVLPSPVSGASGGSVRPLLFYADLIQGQKTGFFLDQFSNIQMAALRFRNIRLTQGQKKIRILDLCCYVGQWGAQLGRVFKDLGLQVEVVAVDASSQALELAQRNIEAEGATCKTLKGDVLKDLDSLPPQSFDIVISDPPAFIKSRKDIPVGKHAYLQLATQAFRLAKVGGGIVSCSCSALLEEEVFSEVLAKAALRNQAQARWVGRGCQALDHPMLAEFPEGRYLKGWVGVR